MRTGQRMRKIYVAFVNRDAKSGKRMYIAADTYEQAFGLAVTEDCQGFMRLLSGAVAFTIKAPIELKLEEIT